MQRPAHSQRCAIYTRKSAAPPLGQEVTSLQSQRTICSSYIVSQQHKSWTELPKVYEDSGRTGSNLNRPALQELLTDIEEGLVDVVLVYKLDRITRTLLDFVRLIDFFERFDVTFVAITQNFDTSDSMGRLIRNVLLTFAQFEREIASDRMRDKKMVMKQSGRWTGGNPPIGYDLRRGKLVPNSVEAAAVCCAYETYVTEQRISSVHNALISGGHRRKIRRTAAGDKVGGNPISLSSLHHILKNPVYIGEVTYRGERFPGLHEPIVERQLWEQAQAVLKERQAFRPRLQEHVLAGLLWDAYGRRMNARQSRNGRGSHSYYESAPSAWAVRRSLKVLRVSAGQIEMLVLNALQGLLSDHAALRELLLSTGVVGSEINTLTAQGSAASVRLGDLKLSRRAPTFKLLISRLEIGFDRVRILLRVDAISAFLRWDGLGMFRMSDLELIRAKQLQYLEVPVHLYRQRRETWLPVTPCSEPGQPDTQLTDLLDDAREAQRLLYQYRDRSLTELAWSLGKKPVLFSRLVRLNYLAPDILAAIADGKQPADLTRSLLMKQDLPLDWALQRRQLGFQPVYANSMSTTASAN
nr:recombinase family protein [uncultured Sphingomonas sp.]